MYLKRWLKPSDISGASDNVKRMMQLLLVDQFLTSLRSEPLRIKLREKKFTTVQAAARQADEYLLHRKMEDTIPASARNVQPANPRALEGRSPGLTKAEIGVTPSGKSSSKGIPAAQKRSGSFESVCFRCRQLGHKVVDCPIPPPPCVVPRQISEERPTPEKKSGAG